MPDLKLLITPPPVPAPYERPDHEYQFALSHDVAEAAQVALAATALELLAAVARGRHPEAGAIEFEYDTAKAPLIQALWPETPSTPGVRPRTLWNRGEDVLIRDHLWIKDMESLLAPAANAPSLPIAIFGEYSPTRYLLRLPAPDVAAALAAQLRRAHPHTTALLISLDSEHGLIDLAVEHLIAPDGTSLFAVPKDREFSPSPQQAWWWRTRRNTEQALRHLWCHPQHRARYFRPQGHESSFWNYGLQAVLLPSTPALPAGQAA
ncbi:hypothetical protein OG196_32110 [Kitasatospora purpeofusca]|uniref:hypothetical protein n=1 Tax=Kitasatospora purpeofusca TaxID=67352 RepID=UPI002E154304|nr:hypothetical protein OG196_32110 [Kitasatospora purpeofusca]